MLIVAHLPTLEKTAALSNTCFLLTSCPSLYLCQVCVTESVTDENDRKCVCSLPYQCNVNAGNLFNITYDIPLEENCQALCSITPTCSTYTYYDTDNKERPKMCILLKSCQKLSQDCVGCHTGPPECSNSE